MKKKSSFKLPKSEVQRIKSMTPTIAELRIIDLMRDYNALRSAYFGKTIPPVEEVSIRFLPRCEMNRLADSDEDIDGLCSFGKHRGIPTSKSIFLADDLGVFDTAITLRHEMAHMKVNLKFGRMMGEGEHWKKEVLRLVAAGAYDGLL